jgi:hypothetical protein
MIRRPHTDEPLDPMIAAELEELERALAGDASADPVLEALVSDVRDDTPAMTPAFRASLDARVDAGFPRESGAGAAAWLTRISPGGALFRPALGVAATAILGLAVATAMLTSDDQPALSGLAAESRDSGAQKAAGDSTTAFAPQAAEPAAPAPGELDADGAAESLGRAARPQALSTPSATSVPEPSTAADSVVGGGASPGRLGGVRRVERSAEMTLSTAPDDVQSVADDVVRTVQGLGGVVASSRVATVDGGGEAFFDLRLPTTRLDRAIAQLSKLAHVSALSQGSDDITGSFVSAADRLKDARDERAALLKALGRATTDRQIASLRARIADSRARIASAEADLRRLRARTDRATVALTIRGDGASRGGSDEDEGGAWTPGDAVNDALRVLEVAAGVAVIAAAALVPLGFLALLAILAARATRRRGRERALDAA